VALPGGVNPTAIISMYVCVAMTSDGISAAWLKAIGWPEAKQRNGCVAA